MYSRLDVSANGTNVEESFRRLILFLTILITLHYVILAQLEQVLVSRWISIPSPLLDLLLVGDTFYYIVERAQPAVY